VTRCYGRDDRASDTIYGAYYGQEDGVDGRTSFEDER
jgi:hypothetical protein